MAINIERLVPLQVALKNLKEATGDSKPNAVEAVRNELIHLNQLQQTNDNKTKNKSLNLPPYKRSGNLPATQSTRQKANDAAVKLLDKIRDEGLNREDLTDEQLDVLSKYTGNGGGLTNKEGKRGSAYEYYTPAEIAAGMWDLASELGFNGGKVLDPSSGTGIFTATSPDNAVIDSIELDETSGGIAKVLNDGERSHTSINPFEKEAARIPDNSLDMVITNVPFGSKTARGANRLLDSAYQDETLENYFILRSLEKIKPGALAIFITPTAVVSGKKTSSSKLRYATSQKAEFLGAYRLPNSVFLQTGADVTTDVVVYRRHSQEALDQIEDIMASGNTDVLKEANVLWEEYLSGDYFKKSGKKFVLGEVVQEKGRFGMTNKVVSTKSTPEIAKMMKKFGGSRIDWDAINAAEPDLITYNNGDVIYQNGKQLEYKDGTWELVENKVTDTERHIHELLAGMGNAHQIITSGITWDDVLEVTDYINKTGQRGLLPERTQALINKVGDSRVAKNNMPAAWRTLALAEAIDETIDNNGYDGFNYQTNEPALTKAMKEVYLDGKNSSLKGLAGQAHKLISLHYNKGNYSNVWLGKVNTHIDDSDAAKSYKSKLARMQYENKSLYLSREQLKQIHPDVDPMSDDNWFLSADGSKVINADDFLVGSLADRLKDIDEQIKATDDEVIKTKLIRQKAVARSKVEPIDFTKMQYDLRSPFIDAETKVKFLKQFVNPAAFVSYDEHGKGTADIHINTSKNSPDTDKLYNRIGDWISKGTVTLGGVKLDRMSDREALDWLTSRINKANAEFNAWIKANDALMDNLDKKGNSDENLYFKQNADDSPIDIAGMNPKLSLHGYQNEFVRMQGRFFGGINGMGVGLGKAQPLTAKVLTPGGWKLMGDIEVGDQVFAYDGTVTTVNGVFPQGEKEIFECVFSDGAKTQCCDEHLWLTQTEPDRKRARRNGSHSNDFSYGSVKQLSELKESLIYGKKQKNHKIPLVGKLNTPAKNLDLDPYLLGVLLGDGNLSHKTVVFTTPESQIVDRVKNILKQNHPELYLHKRSTEYRCDSYGISTAECTLGNNVTKALAGFGLMGTKSDTKFIPEEYLTSSHEQRLDLLHGLLDTDGFVSKDGLTTQYYSTSDDLANGVISLVQSLGGIAWKKSKKTHYKKNGAKFNCKDCWIVSIRMPSDINPFSLKRKAERVKSKSKYLPVRYFVGVNPIGKAQAQCISIDHPSHLYITDDYIVTHNTFTALASVQHVQNIGSKKKTLFVLPNSVLSNWRKEAAFAYESIDDCLYVGLREKDGQFRVFSSKYDEDLLKAIDGKYRKIFMTYEAFRRIRLKDETIEQYAIYLKQTDSAFEDQELKKDDERAKGLVASLIDNIKVNSSAPYLEDMNVDSVVIDEAHAFKNSISAPKTNGRVKYLSLAGTSDRGEDAQAKLFYIRGKTPNNDGVQLLSATPITNSPLEMYSMLSLAGGRKMVNSMAGGIKGADDFIQVMCQIEEEVVPTIDGGERSQNVFTGIRNVQVLRNAIKSTATIKDASDVGLSVVIPEREETATKVTLSGDAKATLETYQLAYQRAKELIKDGPTLGTNDPELDKKMSEAYNEVKNLFDEPDELIAHPFNLIRKMDVLIADDDFAKQATFYDFDSNQKDKAQKVIDKFNSKSPTDERPRLSVFTDPDDATEIHCKDGDAKVLVGYKIKVRAKIVLDSGRERIVIDTLNGNVQSRFEDIADKHTLNLDVTVSAKIAAMLDNFKNEMANPRGVLSDGANSKIVKQIIFCDHIFLHNKIKRLLVKRAGIKADKIAIITGQTNNEPDQMIDIQDGFNAESDDNRYQVVIANQKAEVGINLQKGTQAIHHLTTGWTPDSLEQRNGRGARQGNKTDKVVIYHYDADGTFDEFKRTMINKKDEWISNVLASDDKNTVAVSGGISKEDQEALISIGSDKDAIAKYQAEKDEKEAQARAKATIRRQNINIGIIEEQKNYLDSLDITTFYNDDLVSVIDIVRTNNNNLKNANDTKKTEKTRSNYRKKYDRAKLIALEKLETILGSIEIEAKNFQTKDEYKGPVNLTAEQLYSKIEDNSKDFKPSAKDDRYGSYGSWSNIFKTLLHDNYVESVSIKEDSGYQADYDEGKQTAENMIKQSAKAIDEIAVESGGLPVGAGMKIASGEAKLHRGVYIEKGAIISYADGNLSVVNENLRPTKIGLEGYGKGGPTSAGFNPITDKVILSNDIKYLDFVKRLAEVEDSLYATGELVEAYYSGVIPTVAEYRDDNIKPAWKIESKIEYASHKRLSGAPIPFVLPVSVLNTRTELAEQLIKDYKLAGIDIDLENSTFTVDTNSSADIDGEWSAYGSSSTAIMDLVAGYIKDNNISLTEYDTKILEVGGIIFRLLEPSDDVIDNIDKAMSESFDVKRENTYTVDEFKQAALEIFDKYIPNKYISLGLINSFNSLNKDVVLGKYITAKLNGYYSLGSNRIERLYSIALKEHIKSGGSTQAVSNDSKFMPDTTVAVSGDTLKWKDEIKSYATSYGSNIQGRRKYKWNGKQKYWAISYSAYLKLVEDYPKAKDELIIEAA